MRRYFAIAVTLFAGLALLAGCAEEYPDLEDGLYAELGTTRGTIMIELAYEKAPLTVTNFVGLAEGTIDSSAPEGEPFYDGLSFHRVVEDFVVQTGDPNGDGSGGPGYRFPNEIDESLTHGSAGVVSMANSGPDTNGSQFFITKNAAPWLDGQYSVFGEVVEGQDVVDSIQEGDTLETVKIIRKGESATDFETDQAAFDNRLAELREERREDQRRTVAQQLSYVDKNWPDAEDAGEGMRYVIEEEGSGPSPEAGDTVAVHYTGFLLNGMPFESTREQDEPVEFTLGEERIIEGWERTLLDMRVGEKRRAIIPPNLAYGSRGARDIIPPNSFIVLDVELVGIVE
ncbi:MAG: peptidylprolyl isomerase [Spirochaetes bacterium]|jgi:peptidylprolyl isomerase|nr:peptidylprolyl isomerase [Spirochaetota bacterium]